MTRAFVPGGPEPSRNGLGKLIPLTVIERSMGLLHFQLPIANCQLRPSIVALFSTSNCLCLRRQMTIGNWQSEIENDLVRHQCPVTIRATVAEELPGVAHFTDHVQIQISYHQRILVARRLGNDLPAGITEVALSVKLANVPGLLVTHAINSANEITV